MLSVRVGLGRLGACGLLLTLAACGRGGQDEMAWARAALERNPRLEVVAADAQGHTFTVRLRDSGELRTVRSDELAAMPRDAGAAPVTAPSAVPGATTLAQAGEAATPAPEAAPGPEAASAPAPSPTPPPAGTGPVLKSGPGFSISAGSDAGPASHAVAESGPGYSIRSSGAASGGARAREASVTSAAVERRHEPIVCQGARLLQIDNRNLDFEGDAVSAQDGCEIHITNSHITAKGVGVLARAANVHIDNSLIEGEAGSVDAAQGAQIYATASHFRGLSRREDTAAFHDLGGNIWN